MIRLDRPDVALVIGHTIDRPGAVAIDGLDEYRWGGQVVEAARLACHDLGLVALVVEKQAWGTYRARLRAATKQINASHAKFCVEVHFNAAPAGANAARFRGVCALHWPSSVRGHALAQDVAHAVADATGLRLRYHDGAHAQARSWNGPAATDEAGRPVPGGPPLYILKWTTMPAIVLETHFGTSEKDHELATTHLSAIGRAIASAIRERCLDEGDA